MAWVCVDEDGTELLFKDKPYKIEKEVVWIPSDDDVDEIYVQLIKGSIKKLIGRTLTWDDEPVELKEEEEG